MKRRNVVIFAAMLFLIMLIPLVTGTVQAFNKKGPTPIPGDLIPFPGMHGHKKIHDSIAPVSKSK